MLETLSRSSRICRVPGNSTAYKIIRPLENKKITPGELSSELKLSISAINEGYYKTPGTEILYGRL
jgi:hypothetical protein